jgi:hypothetical protein
LAVSGLQTFVLLLDLLAKGKSFPIDVDDGIQISYFFAVYLVLVQKLQFLPVHLVALAADDLETGLEIVELDGKLLMLIGHPRYLCIDHFIFLLHFINLIIESIVLGLCMFDLGRAEFTFSMRRATYLS